MKSKILKQIYNERRSNAWLLTELILVSAVLWWICSLALGVWEVRRIPMGLDYNDVIRVELATYEQTSPLYRKTDFPLQLNADGDTLTNEMIEKRRIIDRLREDPAVVAVTAKPAGGCELFTYNFFGSMPLLADTTLGVTLNPSTNHLRADDYFFDVFIPDNYDSSTVGQLSRALDEGMAVITDNLVIEGKLTVADLLSRHEEINANGMNVAGTPPVGGVIPPVKRTEYEYPHHASIILKEHTDNPRLIYVRTAPGRLEEVKTRINELDRTLRSTGNVHIADVKDFRQIRNDLHRGDDAAMTNLWVGIIFLFVTVFLGTFGTFWFRTQERVREIAIHKVVGATRASVFGRLIAEGLLLLTVATPVAALIDYGLYYLDLSPGSSSDFEESAATVAVNILIVYAGMVLVVAASIWFPARKAMEIDPAETLRSE